MLSCKTLTILNYIIDINCSDKKIATLAPAAICNTKNKPPLIDVLTCAIPECIACNCKLQIMARRIYILR